MLSWVAMDRMVERKIASDAAFRELVTERPLRSLANRLTDVEVLAKLQTFGITLNRALLEPLCRAALSAEEIARPMIASCAFETREQEMQGDWVWVCMDALWRRWFHEEPSFEMLDDKMQAGYEFFNSGKPEVTCRIWLDAWEAARRLFDKAGVHSIREFDARFLGSQMLFNWIQDLDMELWNAGLRDRQFFRARIAVCEEALTWIKAEDEEVLRRHFRSGLAETYFELGNVGKADALHQTWLDADPQWGWGWINWSERYRFTHTEFRDLHRAEDLLRQGLAVAGVRDAQHLSERLADLDEEQRRGEDARAIQRAAERHSETVRKVVDITPEGNLVQFKTVAKFGKAGLSLDQPPKLEHGLRAAAAVSGPATADGRQKVGRNDPCPCGSGKKFKKCCAE